jgi:hypothetical protein
MHVFRNLNLQRTFSLVVLFVALFSQIQTLYACDSMEAKPKLVCCCGHDSAICPMADSCGMHQQTQQTACCEVSYDTLNDAAMINSTSTVDTLTLLLDGPQPPPIIELQQFLSTPPLPLPSRLLLATHEPPISSRGQSIYLLTRRLRL